MPQTQTNDSALQKFYTWLSCVRSHERIHFNHDPSNIVVVVSCWVLFVNKHGRSNSRQKWLVCLKSHAPSLQSCFNIWPIVFRKFKWIWKRNSIVFCLGHSIGHALENKVVFGQLAIVFSFLISTFIFICSFHSCLCRNECKVIVQIIERVLVCSTVIRI